MRMLIIIAVLLSSASVNAQNMLERMRNKPGVLVLHDDETLDLKTLTEHTPKDHKKRVVKREMKKLFKMMNETIDDGTDRNENYVKLMELIKALAENDEKKEQAEAAKKAKAEARRQYEKEQYRKREEARQAARKSHDDFMNEMKTLNGRK